MLVTRLEENIGGSCSSSPGLQCMILNPSQTQRAFSLSVLRMAQLHLSSCEAVVDVVLTLESMHVFLVELLMCLLQDCHSTHAGGTI